MHGVAGVIRDQSRRSRSHAWCSSQGKNPGGTAEAGRGATGGSNPGGTSGASMQDIVVEVPVVVSWVPMVETVEPDSQRKSKSVGLGETASG
jgi:hypothetical protein